MLWWFEPHNFPFGYASASEHSSGRVTLVSSHRAYIFTDTHKKR